MLPFLCTSCFPFVFLPFSYPPSACPSDDWDVTEIKMREGSLSEQKVKFGNNVGRRIRGV